MSKELETLQLALEVAGSKEALCAELWISRGDLDAYLTAMRPVPEVVFQAALDLLARRKH